MQFLVLFHVKPYKIHTSEIIDDHRQKTHAQFAKLDCKGAEMKHFCCAFLPVPKTLLEKGIPEHQDMIDALQAMVGLVELFDSSGYFPSTK